MESFAITDVLNSETFKSILSASPFEDRAERIRETLREVHHQYLDLRLAGVQSGPEVDYALLEEVAYYLSGVATTPGRSEGIVPALRSQMMAVSALIFEYLGDMASTQPGSHPALDDSLIYYLDACICNSLGLFEANSSALARKHLINQEVLEQALIDSTLTFSRNICQQILYIWLARQIPSLWQRRRKIEFAIKNSVAKLDGALTNNQISRLTYGEMRYWLALAEGVTLHSRFFQFGKIEYIDQATAKFSYSIELAKKISNPPLVWTAYAIQKCGEGMRTNSVWNQLGSVCPDKYIRRLVTSPAPVLELWSSQVAALEATLQNPITKDPISLDHGYLDSRVRRVVIGMPTSAGKTLLAELAIVRTLFPNAENSKLSPDVTCIYVVPSLALESQIEAKLLGRLLPLGIRVTAIFGGYDTTLLDDGLFAQTRVAIVTPEKLDMLIRQDHPFIQRCGLYVFDEIHKVDNIGRGWTMEVVMTWLKDFHPIAKNAKMLFMSAVMPNILQINMWVREQVAQNGSLPTLSVNQPWQPTRQLKGYLEIDANDLIEKIENPPRTEYWRGGHLNYVSDRNDLAHPRQIRRLIKSKETIISRKKRKTQQFYTERESENSFGVEENAGEVAKKYVAAKLDPVLVFFISREETRNFCKYLVSHNDYSPTGLSNREEQQYKLFLQYLSERLGDQHPLSAFAAKGIAYHHGYLPRDVRSEIEYAFSQRWIRVLASTTTLTDGVNFPISTFILANYERVLDSKTRSLWHLEKKDFQNMIGRAGRAVYETEGQIIFMVPSNRLAFSEVTWQDYLFARNDDSDRLIQSSLNRPKFKRRVLEQILHAMSDPITAIPALSVDPDEMNAQYGPGAKEIGDTILRLQAFLLALTDKEVIDPEKIETILGFLKRTLFGSQQPEETFLKLVTDFSQTTGKLVALAQPDKQRRAVYGRIGLGFTSCQNLYAKAQDFWSTHKNNFETNLFLTSFLNDIGNLAPSLPEIRPAQIVIPHTRPNKYLELPHGEIVSKWVVDQAPLSVIRETYFKKIEDPGDRAEACANYVRDSFEYRLPWMLGAFHISVADIAQRSNDAEFINSNLDHQLSMIPAYVKFGVNNPAAVFFSMLGISLRRVAILLGNTYNQENAGGTFDFPNMLRWILELEPEQVSVWFNKEYGDDVVGDLPRLFRFLDSIRSQEQSLDDFLPLELQIAGWHYYANDETFSRITVGERLTLKIDPLNPWDPNAVQIFNTRNNKLGFIPREWSRAVQNHITSDLPLRCSVAAIDPHEKYRPIRIKLDIADA